MGTRRLLIVCGSIAGAVFVLLVVAIGIRSVLRPKPRVTLAAFAGQPAPKPEPPFQLTRPSLPSDTFEGVKLSGVSAEVLASEARGRAQEGEYRPAVQLQAWAVERGDGGYYDLACYYSRTGDVEAAMYWLQEAGLEEGVDGAWARDDPDLRAVRRDSRWKTMVRYLDQCNAYWVTSGVNSTAVVTPNGYTAGEPITVLVGLHGLGSNPEDFVDGMQEAADACDLAFVGISGTIPRGKSSYVWSDDPKENAQRVASGLQEVSDRVRIDPERIILYGFSQGGLVAAELVARHPDRYAGAISLSSGGNELLLDEVTPTELLKTRGVVCLCGAEEHPLTLLFTSRIAHWFESAGARVQHKTYPGMYQHTFPPDFYEKLPEWVAFILGE